MYHVLINHPAERGTLLGCLFVIVVLIGLTIFFRKLFIYTIIGSSALIPVAAGWALKIYWELIAFKIRPRMGQLWAIGPLFVIKLFGENTGLAPRKESFVTPILSKLFESPSIKTNRYELTAYVLKNLTALQREVYFSQLAQGSKRTNNIAALAEFNLNSRAAELVDQKKRFFALLQNMIFNASPMDTYRVFYKGKKQIIPVEISLYEMEHCFILRNEYPNAWITHIHMLYKNSRPYKNSPDFFVDKLEGRAMEDIKTMMFNAKKVLATHRFHHRIKESLTFDAMVANTSDLIVVPNGYYCQNRLRINNNNGEILYHRYDEENKTFIHDVYPLPIKVEDALLTYSVRDAENNTHFLQLRMSESGKPALYIIKENYFAIKTMDPNFFSEEKINRYLEGNSRLPQRYQRSFAQRTMEE